MRGATSLPLAGSAIHTGIDERLRLLPGSTNNTSVRESIKVDGDTPNLQPTIGYRIVTGPRRGLKKGVGSGRESFCRLKVGPQPGQAFTL